MLIPSSISVAPTATTIAVLTTSMVTVTAAWHVIPGRVRGSRKYMSTEDKLKNKIDDLGGRAKEAIGKATGNDDTRAEGRADQAKSSLKDAGEKVKDAFRK
jgi:uncharacterized protein YjbJ (UPF0337 family)